MDKTVKSPKPEKWTDWEEEYHKVFNQLDSRLKFQRKEILEKIKSFYPVWEERHPDSRGKFDDETQRNWYVKNFLSDVISIIESYE